MEEITRATCVEGCDTKGMIQLRMFELSNTSCKLYFPDF
jgi:hypothetical protein